MSYVLAHISRILPVVRPCERPQIMVAVLVCAKGTNTNFNNNNNNNNNNNDIDSNNNNHNNNQTYPHEFLSHFRMKKHGGCHHPW